jgi:hypothetical protein
MSFKVYKGKPQINYFRKTDTTVRILNGSAVMLGATGRLLLPNNDSDDRVLGVSKADMPVGADTNAVYPVALASEDVTWEVDVDSDGGAAATDVGRFVALDTTADTTGSQIRSQVDVSDSGIPHFYITEVVSASLVRGKFGRTALRQPQGDAYDS